MKQPKEHCKECKKYNDKLEMWCYKECKCHSPKVAFAKKKTKGQEGVKRFLQDVNPSPSSFDEWFNKDFSCEKEYCDLCIDCFEKLKSIVERDYHEKSNWNEYLKENFISKFIVERDYKKREDYDRLISLINQHDKAHDKLYIEKQKVLDFLNTYQPYPEDIFLSSSKEKLKFNRGRFNVFCRELINSFKDDIKKELKL